MRSAVWLVGIVAVLALLSLLFIQTKLSKPPQTATTTSRSTRSTETANTRGNTTTSTSVSEPTSKPTSVAVPTYKYNLTVLSFEIQVYNYTYDNQTSVGQAFLSWVLTATSATNNTFTVNVKQYESATGGEIVGFYSMPLEPGESSVLKSKVFKVNFSYPPEENGYSVGWYKAKMIHFNLSGDWNVFVLRPS